MFIMFVISFNTIKEFIRNKIVYIILGLSIWLIFFTIVLSKLALSEQKKIILDFALMIIELFWLILTLFLGSSLLMNEFNKNTILLILSKSPIKRDFILWKFFWFTTILALLYSILFIAFLLVLFIHNIWFEMAFFWAVFLSFIKIVVLLSFIIFFSTFMSPLLTLLVSLCIYIVSHMTVFLKFYTVFTDRVQKGWIYEWLINLVYYVFPNFQDLSMKEYLFSPTLWAYNWLHISLSILANLAYIIVLLFFTIIIFQRKEF